VIALVTGGSGAVGSAICGALAGRGAHVVVGYLRGAEAAERVAAELRAAGRDAAALGFDVADPAACDRAVRAVVERHGALHAVVNAAGCTADGLLNDLQPEAVQKVLSVNVAGALNVVRAALPHLMACGRGRVVNVSSVLGSRGTQGTSAYASSKGALDALTRALAVELGPRRITVNAVAAGFVNGGMGRTPVARMGAALRRLVPAGRPGTPAEVGAVVAFLASEDADYVSGAVVPVDGGMLACAVARAGGARDE